MKYNRIKVGMFKEITHLITQDDIKKFVELTGDDNKLHLDKEFASKTPFKKPLAHGMLGASFISTVIGTQLPGDGALWFSQNIDFLSPVREGDLLTIRAEVLSKDDRNKSIELSTNIFNQNKEKVIMGTAKVKVIEEKENVIVNEKDKKRKIKNALIIGATGGIGTETCLKLASLGYNIVIHYFRNKVKAQKLKDEIKALGVNAYIFNADISKRKFINELFSSISNRVVNLDLLVNCATIRLPSISFENLDWDEIKKNLDINIKSNFYLVKNILPIFKSQEKGKIIFLTTQYIETAPPTKMLPYVTSKSALNGLAKSLAVELSKFNITVNMVSPGMTDTDLIANVPEKYRMLTAAKAPLKRLASPKDIASTISFLATESGDYITGETIRVNGGQTML